MEGKNGKFKDFLKGDPNLSRLFGKNFTFGMATTNFKCGCHT
jgi:hypothetical protein